MHIHAQHAIRAAQLRPTIGHWAAWRYCQLRGVPFRLYTLARVLEAVKQAEKEFAK
jgi:hypothetical protein